MKKRWIECKKCGGSGKIDKWHGGEYDGYYTCPECNGRGGHFTSTCSHCGGSGYITEWHGGEYDRSYKCPYCSD